MSLYRAFPSTLLSKVGLPLPVSLFLWNWGGLVNDGSRIVEKKVLWMPRASFTYSEGIGSPAAEIPL